MISAQFAAQAESENHPCHEIIHQSEHQPRHLKNTLKNVLQNARTELNISEDSGNKEIHTGTVRKYLNEEKVNRVLGTKPPLDPDKSEIKEKNLSRDEEVRIMQLRSGFFPNLAEYKSRIRNETSNLCRKCKTHIETVNHALPCIVGMEPQLLWTNPEAVAVATSDL